MSALGIASLGAQCANKALGIASMGVFCGGIIDVPNPIEPGGGAKKTYYSPSQNSDQQKQNKDLLMMLAQSIFQIID